MHFKSFLKILFIFLYGLSLINNAYANEIKLMTYNIGSLPSPLGIQINKDILKPNVERVQEITNILLQWNQNNTVFYKEGFTSPDVIAFEEAFDPNVRSIIKQKLSTFYPYNSGTMGEKALNAGSGLLVMSKFSILGIDFHGFTNAMIGEESLANKGYMALKLKYNNNYFFTVIATHLSGGCSFEHDKQSQDGTTSFRRGEQLGHIFAEIETKATTPPGGYEDLKYLKTFVVGDFNTTLSSERQQKSISTGMSNNGYKKDQIKYPGQYCLFSILENVIPKNFLEVRLIADHPGPKTIDPNLLQQAISENKFTGTTYGENFLKQNRKIGGAFTRQNTEYKIIDGIFPSKDGTAGTIENNIFNLNEASAYPYALSDHLTLYGKFDFN